MERLAGRRPVRDREHGREEIESPLGDLRPEKQPPSLAVAQIAQMSFGRVPDQLSDDDIAADGSLCPSCGRIGAVETLSPTAAG
nr:hypothetical protein [Sphingomonas sp.]